MQIDDDERPSGPEGEVGAHGPLARRQMRLRHRAQRAEAPILGREEPAGARRERVEFRRGRSERGRDPLEIRVEEQRREPVPRTAQRHQMLAQDVEPVGDAGRADEVGRLGKRIRAVRKAQPRARGNGERGTGVASLGPAIRDIYVLRHASIAAQ